MSAKKLINDPAHVVEEMLEGIVLCGEGLAKLDGWNVIVRSDVDEHKKDHVSIVSGGGSGHEPSHAGWVGSGMLSAAVAGNVFASPSTQAVLAAILATTGPKGCLLIIKNYTGDRLNFGLAAEQAKSRGFKVEMVVVGDDCALPHRAGGIAGRRGVAGTVFVHKVAGAAAEQGSSLEDVKAAAEQAASRIGTMGVALSVCTIPGKPADNNRLGHDQCEVGMGIHGEQGAVTQQLQSCDLVVDQALEFVFRKQEGWNYLPAPVGSEVAVLVNNLGGTTPMELAIVARRAIATLTHTYNLIPTRLVSGTLMSSLDMAGFSISVFVLTPELTAYLDASTRAPAWPATIATQLMNKKNIPCPSIAPPSSGDLSGSCHVTPEQAALFKQALEAACHVVIAQKDQLTEWDKKVGDGDCGDTLETGAKNILAAIPQIDFAHPGAAFAALASSMETMGGTSGAVYSILCTSVAASLLALPSRPVERSDWNAVASAAVATVTRYGGASQGDRTMVDALYPATQVLSQGGSIAAAAEAAQTGANNTVNLKARAGRSSYVPEDVLRSVPDPGAMAAAAWISSVASVLN
eukprot:c7718_g1_i1.p1 GENE.c7718_g1_i1~~c7718_g1_i1.p1  ORF type:complete len:588 (-),score=184.24 c7718_g1_i1:119-1849(-)